MSGLARGLYEQLMTEGLEEALSTLDSNYRAARERLHQEEVADRIALHPAALVRRRVSGSAYRRLLDEAIPDNQLTEIPLYLQQQRACCRDDFRKMVKAATHRFAGTRPAHRPRRATPEK